jgi:hypothetical protein
MFSATYDFCTRFTGKKLANPNTFSSDTTLKYIGVVVYENNHNLESR